ncbi:hypothetical protein R3P38DRAFT_420361 [Favolaschia claudopus]|uniref:MYND-type domain-containing protein n=1 Tax=Favolaschia claudopus TaxID=2862362 RepID=A0AAW0CPJ0_9AGAR
MPPDEPDDTSSPDSVFRQSCECASRAIMLLHLFGETSMRSAAGSLWRTRIWPWVQLMDNYDCFPVDVGGSCGRCSLLKFIAPILAFDTTIPLFFGTPEIGGFIAHVLKSIVCCWNKGLITSSPSGGMVPLQVSAVFFRRCIEYPRVLDDLVDGVGGMDKIAVLFVEYAVLVLRELRNAGSQNSGRLDINFVVENLKTALGFLEDLGEAHRTLWGFLADSKYVVIAIRSIKALASRAVASANQNFKVAMVEYLQIITLIIQDMNAKQLAKALNAGLIEACRMCDSLVDIAHESLDIHVPLTVLYTQLCWATLDYPTLCTIAKNLLMAVEVDRKATEGSAGDFPYLVSEAWTMFIGVMVWRLNCLGQYHSIDTRSCYNFECPMINVEKRQLRRRCTGCTIAFYCSQECQKACWMTYGHRKLCQSTSSSANSYNRNLRFKRFLYLQDYLSDKTAMYLLKLEHIYLTGGTDFCVELDYTNGYCVAGVAPLKMYAHLFPSGILERRGKNGAGSLELHVMRRNSKFNTREAFALPLVYRCSSFAALDGLVKIAGELPEGSDIAFLELKDSHPAVFQKVCELAELEMVETYEGDNLYV